MDKTYLWSPKVGNTKYDYTHALIHLLLEQASEHWYNEGPTGTLSVSYSLMKIDLCGRSVGGGDVDFPNLGLNQIQLQP